MAVAAVAAVCAAACAPLCTDVGAARLHPGRHRGSDRGGLLRDVPACSRSAASRSWNRSSLGCSCCCSHGSPSPSCPRWPASVVLLFRKKDELGIDPTAPLPAIRSRTAMLLPTYNEDPYRVLARLRAIYESVEETGHGAQFDWFVLSDTTDPAIWIAEEKCFLQLRQEVGSAARIFYRHRPENTARKSGNIEDWVRRFGADYECMLILDADSLMTGDTIVRLVAAMEAASRCRR